MALNCINLHQKGFGGRGAAPDPTGGLGGPLDPRPESMAMNIFTTTSLVTSCVPINYSNLIKIELNQECSLQFTQKKVIFKQIFCDLDISKLNYYIPQKSLKKLT